MQMIRTILRIFSLLALLFLGAATSVILIVLNHSHTLEPAGLAVIGSVVGVIALLLLGWFSLAYRFQLGIFILVAGSIFGGMGTFWFSNGVTVLLIVATIGVLVGGIAVFVLGWRYLQEPSRSRLGAFAL